MASERLAGPLAVCGAVACWGLVPVSTRYLVDTLTPGQLLVARFSFGALVALLLFVIWRPSMPTRRNMPKAVGLGVFATLSFNVPVAYGINIIEGGTAALLIGMQPIFITVLAGLFLKEHVPRRMIAGLLFALVGSSIIALTAGGGFTLQGRYLLGCGLVLLGAFLFSSYSVAAKPHFGPDLPAPIVAMIGTVLGLPFVAPLGAGGIGDKLSSLPPVGWLALLLLAAGASVLAPVLWNVGLSLGQASRASLYLNLLPVFGVVTSVTLLDEPLRAEMLFGGGLILAGILMATVPVRMVRRRVSPARRGC